MSISQIFDTNNSAAVIVTIIACFASLIFFKAKKNSTTEKKPHPLPPNGPSFQQMFLEGGLQAQNQLEIVKAYGTTFTIPSPLPLLIPNQVVICEPAVVKELCIKQANMYRPPSNFTTRTDVFGKAVQKVAGRGVTGLKGDEWQWRKKALLKEFHRNKLLSDEKGLLQVIIDKGRHLCQKLQDASEKGEVVEADVLTTEATVGVVLFFLFGRQLQFDTKKVRLAAKQMIECLLARLTDPLYEVKKYIPTTSAYQTEITLKHSQKVVDDVVGSEVDLMLEEYYGRVDVHQDRKKGSVIATLIENEPRFREHGKQSMLAEEARVLVQAGFDTTAHSLAFTMGMMAERPDLADSMAECGKNAFGLPDEVKMNDIVHNDELWNEYFSVDKMKDALEKTQIVNNFFHESLRLYPLVPSLGGLCTGDVVIETKHGKKYTLPNGTATLFLNVPLQRVHLSKPNEIIPDRWNTEHVRDQPFLHTFQNGPHICPGKPLSLLEGRVFLLLIVMLFEFDFNEGTSKVEFEDSGLLRPKDGMLLIVKKRL